MAINPERLSWNAPTQNVDGSPIEAELNYRLVVNGSDFADFPGSLNPDGSFSQPISALTLPAGTNSLSLRAFYLEDPSLISDPSNVISVVIVTASPEEPTGFFAD